MPARRALLLCVVLLGCGAAERPAPRRARAHVEPMVQSEIAPPVCRIAATRGEGLTVAPAGIEPFGVSVSDGALALVPLEDDRRVGVEVEHPLRFSASARAAEQRLALARDGELAAGAVVVTRGAPVLTLARTDAGLAASVQLGRDSPALARALALAVGPVPLGCEDVVAEPDAEPSVLAALPRRVPGGELRVAATLPLVVRPLRLGPTRVEVRPETRGGFVPVWMIDRQSDDVRVVIPFSDGARVEGWVPLTALREPTAAEAELMEALTSVDAPEPVSLGLLGVIESTHAGPQSDEYVGLASLRPSSAIYTAPDGARWAVSAEQPLEVRVRWQRGSAHAQLLEIPGMWVPPERTWVQRGDVSLGEP